LIEPKGSVKNTDGKEVTRAEARKTALLVAAALLVIATLNYYRGRTTVAAVAIGLCATLILIGLTMPPVARYFHIGWMKFAEALGYVNSRVLLTLVYYFVFTPYSLVSRLIGRDPLRRRGKPQESYWTERKVTRQSREQFERSF
jgi:hypothetical protein